MVYYVFAFELLKHLFFIVVEIDQNRFDEVGKHQRKLTHIIGK